MALALLLWPGLAAAHEAGFSGQLTATLHFRPDDKPVAGESSDIRLIDLKNAAATFSPADCICDIQIRRNGRLLKTLPLRTDGLTLTANYEFLDAGSYDLLLSGRPRAGAAFTPFTINYRPAVSRAAGGTAADAWVLAIGAILLTLLAFVAARLLRPSRQSV